MRVPRRTDAGRFLGELLDADWDSASLRLSDDEDETSSLLNQLEGQLEEPAFEHRVPHSDDVSMAASDTKDDDQEIVGEVNARRVGVRFCMVVVVVVVGCRGVTDSSATTS